MSREWMLQCGILYLPVLVTALLLACARDESRHPAALLMSLTWQAALLPVVDTLCQWLGCWHYLATPWSVLHMPLAVHLGWVVWWGAAMPLMLECLSPRVSRRGAWCAVMVIAVGLDLWLMPMLHPVVTLSARWLCGEALMTLMVLLPGVALYEWTKNARFPLARGLMISLAFALLVLWILPVSTLTTVPHFPAQRWFVFFVVLLPIVFPGIWAVVLFGTVGKGTPVPFDPPRHLVTSGIYRCIANPMQASILLAMLWVAWFLSHRGLAIAAVSTWVYSIGIARWSENIDLTRRFGEAWLKYRRETPSWRVRWRKR